jgi:glycine oxidase
MGASIVKEYDVIIIGGGVIGCSIAYELAKQHKQVAVLEQGEISSGASRAAAGILGAQAEIDEEGPLLQFALSSRELFKNRVNELREVTGIDAELIEKGVLKVATTEDGLEELKRKFSTYKKWDSSVEWLTTSELKKREKMLSSTIKGGISLPNDGQLNAFKYTKALAYGTAVYGGDLYEHCHVSQVIEENGCVKGVTTSQGTFATSSVVVTTGAWTSKLLSYVTEKKVYPVKGECMLLKSNKPILEHTIYTPEAFYIVPKAGGKLLVGATRTPHTFDRDVTFGGMSKLFEKAKELIPELAHSVFLKSWTGLRPQTDDGWPYLGESPYMKGCFLAYGHYRNGILLSAKTGELMRDLINGTQPKEHFFNAFSPERAYSLKGG